MMVMVMMKFELRSNHKGSVLDGPTTARSRMFGILGSDASMSCHGGGEEAQPAASATCAPDAQLSGHHADA